MSEAPRRPALVFIVGPPAVGKMAVGDELARRTGLKLFHNHHTIDLALRFFPFGSPPFQRLVGEFRRRIFEEVAGSSLPGLIFTYVWAFDHQSDDDAVAEYAAIFSTRGGRVMYVELECELEERLRRNETEFRLAEKPFKRDLPQSRQQLLEADAKYQLNSHGKYEGRPDYLHIDNTALAASDAAKRIIERFALPAAEPLTPAT
jgi:shikimate kinase